MIGLGLFLILAGLLIYLNPRLVVAMVSGFLVAAGASLILLRWRLRRMANIYQSRSPWARFFIRF